MVSLIIVIELKCPTLRKMTMIISQNTIGRLYLYLDNIENATCWNLQTISENICTTITTKDLNSSWSTLSKHNRDWILTQMKRASEAILSDYWVFKIPKD